MGLFSKRPLITVTDLGPKEKPKSAKKKLPPTPVVLQPICRDEAYLTVKGGMKWDRDHLALYEAELGGR